jgi:transcriptional regulator with XRE-family HTH domain
MHELPEADVAFGEHMRRWREDRLLRVTEVAAMLDVDEVTLEAWESGVGLPPDTQDVALWYRSLQTAAGEEHRDIHTKDGVVYGISVEDVQRVWQRYMTRAAEQEQAREVRTQAGQRERDVDFDQGEAPGEESQERVRYGGAGRRAGGRRRRRV